MICIILLGIHIFCNRSAQQQIQQNVAFSGLSSFLLPNKNYIWGWSAWNTLWILYSTIKTFLTRWLFSALCIGRDISHLKNSPTLQKKILFLYFPDFLLKSGDIHSVDTSECIWIINNAETVFYTFQKWCYLQLFHGLVGRIGKLKNSENCPAARRDIILQLPSRKIQRWPQFLQVWRLELLLRSIRFTIFDGF